MGKKEIKSKIDEIKTQIKLNSKDAHFADKLLFDLLSLKGQYEHQPTMVHIPMDEVIDSIEGNTFTLYKTSSGMIGYHLPCGYDVIVSPAVKALHDELQWLIDSKETIDGLSEEDKDLYFFDFECATKLLTLPMFAAVDYDFKIDTMKLFLDYMLKAQDRLENMEFTPEDLEADNEFKTVMAALEEIKNELNNTEE